MRNRLHPWFEQPRLIDEHPLEAVIALHDGDGIIAHAELSARSQNFFEMTTVSQRDWMGYFDRRGRPMCLLDFGRLMEDGSYTRVEMTQLADCWVSTIWRGLDRIRYMARNSPPDTFETKIFCGDYFGDGISKGRIDTELPDEYPTEKIARASHEAIVREQRERLARVS